MGPQKVMKVERDMVDTHSISLLLKFKLFQSAKTQFSPLPAHPYKTHTLNSSARALGASGQKPLSAETFRQTQNSSARGALHIAVACKLGSFNFAAKLNHPELNEAKKERRPAAAPSNKFRDRLQPDNASSLMLSESTTLYLFLFHPAASGSGET